jgi:stearoyl-CoA desaturase (Delta-9 desaturase)
MSISGINFRDINAEAGRSFTYCFGMTKTEKAANLAGVVVPFLGVIAAIVLLWQRWVDATDLALLAGFYLLTAVGVTVGFHRLLTHRAFQTHPAIERVFAILGSLSVQGSVLDWVADHRKHHAHTDVEGDPHSPHVGHGSGIAGLWHAHAGWLTRTQGQANWKRYAPDLYEDPKMRRIGRRFPMLAGLSLLLPTAAGYVLDGFTLQGAIRGYIWGGLVRIFLVHHVTWSVNSVCHFFGRRRFDVEDRSTNVAWLALLSLGESWHHNHHTFPRSAQHGLRWWEIDPSALIITGLERVGLAWNVVRIAPERQAARLAPRFSAPAETYPEQAA